MTIVRSDEVDFTPGIVENYRRRILVDPDKGSGAITLGEAIMDPGAELPMHTHRVEEVMVITRGAVTAVLDGETCTMNQGDVILVPAGVAHLMGNRSKEPAGFLFFYPAVGVGIDRV